MEKIASVDEVLRLNLIIPNYQRPYKWNIRNVSELLSDILAAISNSSSYQNYKYRLGTVILYSKNNEYEIVDGQQRIITLLLIKLALNKTYNCSLINNSAFHDPQSKVNIYDNFRFIKEWMSINSDVCEALNKALSDVFEFVILEVNDISLAFQMFDSQNTRGKELDPHDLLKAYHLREMNNYSFEKLQLIRRWEEIPPKVIRELFSLYLFPILNWSRKEKSIDFTAKQIDSYKGISDKSDYTYAKRVTKSMPYFQINEPFTAGGDFFNMVDHYVHLLSDIKNEIKTNENFKLIKNLLNSYLVKSKNDEKYSSTGLSYAVNLFYCELLFYYDRFHSLDCMAVTKMFIWAMMIRVDMQNLGYDSINNYAIGVEKDNYANKIPMFFQIACARNHSDIANLKINFTEEEKAKKSNWSDLYFELKKLLGGKSE